MNLKKILGSFVVVLAVCSAQKGFAFDDDTERTLLAITLAPTSPTIATLLTSDIGGKKIVAGGAEAVQFMANSTQKKQNPNNYKFFSEALKVIPADAEVKVGKTTMKFRDLNDVQKAAAVVQLSMMIKDNQVSKCSPGSASEGSGKASH